MMKCEKEMKQLASTLVYFEQHQREQLKKAIKNDFCVFNLFELDKIEL